MSKSISIELKTALGEPCTTIATLWLLVRKDGLQLGFTDSAEPINFSGVTYVSSSGFTPTAVTTTNDLAVDNLDVSGVLLTPGAVLTSNGITEADLQAGLFDYASITISQVNYEDLSQGQIILRKGVLGQVTMQKGKFVAEVRGLTQALQQTIGRLFTASCDADLGDSRCKVNLAAYTVTGTVTAVTSMAAFTDTGRGEPVAWFTFGLLTFTGGDNIGLSKEVKYFSGGGFVLTEAMPYPIKIGDTYSVYAGCDKRFSTCKTKFNNVINFQGFPHIPGQDALIKVGNHQ